MKIPVFLFGLAVATGAALSQTPAPVDTAKPADTTKPAKPADVVISTDPAKPATATPAKTRREAGCEEERGTLGVIEGITLTRPNGQFLGLTLVGGNFKLSFYDKKKKPTKVDVDRALARWPNVHGPGDNRTIMNPSGNALVGSQFVRGPYAFNLFLTLMRGEGDKSEVVETYTVNFHD
ncbi:MAG: hypothetical protein WDM96_10585 [Lacunisphaera sp.]